MSVRTLRKNILKNPLVTFPFWIRFYKDGDKWAGTSRKGNVKILFDTLKELGYDPQLNGKPGTAGENIIEF